MRLVVTTSYPRFAGDAAGNFVETRVKKALAAGQAVQVIAAGQGPQAGDAGFAGLAIWRVPFIPGELPLDFRTSELPPGASEPLALFYAQGAPELFEARPGCALVQAVFFWAGLLKAIRMLEAPFDAIESHWLLPSALAVRAAGLAGPHTAYAHSGDVALLERLPLGPALARWLVGAQMELVFASADLQRRFGRLLGNRADLLGGLGGRSRVEPAQSPLLAELSPRGRDGASPRARPVIVGVGRLVPIKGYDVLVRALGRLPPAQRPELVLVGEGPERARLAEMARARGVALTLAGQRPPGEVARFLAGADLFVHPSRRLDSGRTEGTPVAVAEARAAGLPVVASASGGLAALEGPDVTLVLPDDPASLSAALAAALGLE